MNTLNLHDYSTTFCRYFDLYEWFFFFHLNMGTLFFLHHLHSVTSQLWQKSCVIVCGTIFFNSIYTDNIHFTFNYFIFSLHISIMKKESGR